MIRFSFVESFCFVEQRFLVPLSAGFGTDESQARRSHNVTGPTAETCRACS